MTMTDREILELAAKAAGYDLVRMCDPVESGDDGSEFFHLDGHYWNPITDDGDALRLAVKLRMLVDLDDQSVNGLYFEAGEDRGAAARLTIVQAAAEIGRGTV